MAIEQQTVILDQEFPPDFPYTLSKITDLLKSQGVRVIENPALRLDRPIIEFRGDDYEGWRAAQLFRDYGLMAFDLMRRWTFSNYRGSETHPTWILRFPSALPIGE